MRDSGFSLLNVMMKLVSKHPKRDVVAKLFDLFLNVEEKFVT